jgi:hypothetical protein
MRPENVTSGLRHSKKNRKTVQLMSCKANPIFAPTIGEPQSTVHDESSNPGSVLLRAGWT